MNVFQIILSIDVNIDDISSSVNVLLSIEWSVNDKYNNNNNNNNEYHQIANDENDFDNY